MGRQRGERRELSEGADEMERRGGLIYEEESTATRGRAEQWESGGGQGVGSVVEVAGVRGGQAADKARAGMRKWMAGREFLSPAGDDDRDEEVTAEALKRSEVCECGAD